MNDALIRLMNITMRFDHHTVLSNLSIDIHAQQTIAIIGESGCGKSVTLKLLVGLLKPSEGEVLFEGKPVPAMTQRELAKMRQRVGFLFQQSALFDSLNVYDNVAFGLRTKGRIDSTAIRQRVRDRLSDVGLPPHVETKMPAELSGGMRKRVALARALALDPDVMLYDEPTTGLDPIMTDVINELILQTRKKRPITSLVVTHEMRTVYKVADRVVMLYPYTRLQDHEPQVIYDGPPSGLADCKDERVRHFVEGNASGRILETSEPVHQV